MNLPSFQELYDEFVASVTSDPDHTLDAFTAGSMLDAFAAIAASAGQGIMRWIQRTGRRYFRRTAEGDDLTNIVYDRYRLTRADTLDATISDEDWNAWLDEWLTIAIGRGTLPAMQWWVDNLVAGVDEAEVTEDQNTGVITITVTAEADATNATVKAAIVADLDEWKPGGHPVNVTVTGGL